MAYRERPKTFGRGPVIFLLPDVYLSSSQNLFRIRLNGGGIIRRQLLEAV
jgi:hypothetical protein